MADDAGKFSIDARERAYATPLEDFDVADLDFFESGTQGPWFERLRRECPVHYCAASTYGPYWSITRFDDIVAVDSNHEAFSSDAELGGFMIADGFEPRRSASFLGLDPPDHDVQRRAVAPMFTTDSIAKLEPLIRERAARILDELPRGEVFDFVDLVSVELTSQMLATLFDYPFERRRDIPRISDLILMIAAIGETHEVWAKCQAELLELSAQFIELWNLRKDAAPSQDLISMLAHDPHTRKDDDRSRYFGNLLLLTIAGSDTTRHAISGGMLAFHENPECYRRLRERPELLRSAVPEIIRWQSPLAHMRRTALIDITIGGQRIHRGDKVVMWYLSGNRDADAIADPDTFIIDRERPRHHAAFGFGIHRCLGSRLAEMQLRVVWEEILSRFEHLEVVGEPRRLRSNFVRGYESLPVRILS